MHCQPKWRDLVDSGWLALQRLLSPAQCLVCGGKGQEPAFDLCPGCERDLTPLGTACRRCAQPLSAAAPPDTECGRCLQRPPRFEQARSAFRYEDPIDQLIRAFKYHGNLAAGRLLAQLFCRHVQLDPSQWPGCIVPVPLATARYRARGFNQAIELGRLIARHWDVPLRTDLVVRTRETLEQAGLEPRERRRNVRRAFAVVEPLPCRHVAILDDVMTTGSTVNEVARVLQSAGAREVVVWTIARAGLARN